MIYLNTPIAHLGREPAVRIANMALRWCKKTFGVNNRKKYEPIWTIHKGCGDNVCGEYDDADNEVHIYWDQCEDAPAHIVETHTSDRHDIEKRNTPRYFGMSIKIK